VLGIPASFWMNREKEYRKEIYEIEQQEQLVKQYDWLKEFPVSALKKLGWIEPLNEKGALVGEMLSYFSVASPQEWQRIYVAKEVSVAFRISLANTKSPHAISAWLRKGEIEATKLKLPTYDKAKFKQALLEIKNLVHQFPPDFAAQLQQICAQCGVAVTYVPNLPKAPISGASRWHYGKPLIQLSGRYKTDDHFWFTFYHEAAHILLHGKKEIFLENVEGSPIDQAKEDEANQFAANALLMDKELDEIINAPILDRPTILKFAKKFNTSAGVIIGRLQHLKLINYSDGNDLRHKIDLFG
jgi:Zn-dependent peptidase ImmA (M78 family)